MIVKREFTVGIVAVATLVILYVGVSFMRGKKLFVTDNVYHAVYDESQGLVASNPVLLKGTVVGKVESVKVLPDRNYKVMVTFTAPKNIQLTDATKARLISKGLLGPQAIDLVIGEGNPIASNSEVVGELEPSFRETISQTTLPALNDAKNISLLVSQFVTKLAENTDKINSIFNNLEVSTQELKTTVVGNKQRFKVISKDIAKVSSALSSKSTGISPLMKKLHQLGDGVNKEDVQLAVTKLNKILTHVEEMLAQANEKGSEDALYRNLNKVLVDLDHLLVDVKKRPGRYVSFSIFGGKASKQPNQK